MPSKPEDYLYEYAVIRYVPDVERGEFVNVGLLMMCKRRRWIRMEVRLPLERLAAFDAPHSPAEIGNALDGWRKIAEGSRETAEMADWPVEERFRWLTAAKSASLQTSAPHPGLCTDLDSTFAALTARLL